MSGIIYHAFDTSTGKSYVGQTWLTIEERRKQHHSKNSACRVLRDALIERSKDFVWTKLVEVETQCELNAAELYWGTFFNCIFPYGYSLRLGHSRGRLSEETKTRMSIVKTGSTLSTEHRLAISVGSIGKKMSLESRKKIAESVRNMSDETRQKLSMAASNKKASRETKAKMSLSQKLRRQREHIR